LATTSDDTEITLGVGKLLGLFFLLAAICGVFFSIGYSLGRGSGREQAANDQPQVASTSEAPAKAGDANKPSAAVQAKQDTQAPATEPAPQTPLTFYKAVQQNSTGEAAAAEKQPTSKPAEPAAKTTESTPPAVAEKPSPHVASSPVTGPGTIVVQIAALTREDDAVSLAGALRKKNYNVFVVNNPAMNDKFYHVQVGPFATVADAQEMKAKLVAEGYNPIIKK
jgi:cell division septation protein DedD